MKNDETDWTQEKLTAHAIELLKEAVEKDHEAQQAAKAARENLKAQLANARYHKASMARLQELAGYSRPHIDKWIKEHDNK